MKRSALIIAFAVALVWPQPTPAADPFADTVDKANKKLVTEPLSVARFLNGNSRSRQLIDSQSVSLKSDFFANHLVGVVGVHVHAREALVQLGGDAAQVGGAHPPRLASVNQRVEGHTRTRRNDAPWCSAGSRSPRPKRRSRNVPGS